VINALTVDVEEYFHVMAFEKAIDPADWDNLPSRVQHSIQRILELFGKLGVRGTFFMLGWVAERHPSLLKQIVLQGHEVASHGYGHRLVSRLGPDEFRADIRKSKKIIEDITGEKIQGYRAPSYSITRDSLWAFDILLEEGFSYDSSLFPIRHDLGGMPGAMRFPHWLEWEGGRIVEFPFSTVKVGSMVLPVAGGGYLRLVPAWVTALGIDRINRYDRQPAALYFHPWEIDPDQPRVRCSLLSRFRHYQNLRSTFPKIETILGKFQFAPMKDILDGMRANLQAFRV
jgi:polysaccharide deacetylase family protein (PEP-CTERM system associated)